MNRRKKIIAILAALAITNSSCGVLNENLKLTTNETTKQEQLEGCLLYKDLKYCYIVESIDKNGYQSLNFVYDKHNDAKLYENLGEIVAIYPFKEFIEFYDREKTIYNPKDINDILNLINKDYNKIKTNKDIKKLTLKK